MKLKTMLSQAALILTGAALAAPMAMARSIVTKSAQMEPSGVVVETTHIQGVGSDSLAIGDPYGNRPLSAKAEQGPAATQAAYGEDCQESRCLRAKQRQMSSPHWQAK